MPAKPEADPYETIAELKREVITLKVQLLTLTRDLANVVAILSEGRLKENGWETWPVRQ